jgi:hypothetical protein
VVALPRLYDQLQGAKQLRLTVVILGGLILGVAIVAGAAERVAHLDGA